MLISSSAYSQVTANFTTNGPTTACGMTVVDFQDLSTGNPISWLWDLGNGNTSTLQNPVAVYNSPGIYNVRLTVSDGMQSNSKTEMAFITVHELPEAVIDIASSDRGCVPHTIDFLDQSVTNGQIINWFWDFGDGGNSTLQHPNYSYSTVGSYTVSLLVTDANACQHVVSMPNYISVVDTPKADFVADKLISCNSTEAIHFTNHSFGSGLTYLWDFGDGTTSTLQNPTHTFNSGIYTINLYINNGYCTDVKMSLNYITIGANIEAGFIANNNLGCNDLMVQFTDISTVGTDAWLWNFGDGTTSALQNPTHTYSIAGSYDVLLETSMGATCFSDTLQLGIVEVFDNPAVSFSADSTFACNTPFVVNFTDNSIGATTWNWDFGNGNTSTLQNPTEVFVSSGFYNISLTITDNNGCVGAAQNTNFIEVDFLDANFTATEVNGCNPLNSSFNDISNSYYPITAWNWDFGDGSTASVQHPSHLYSNSGFYSVGLTVTDSRGCASNEIFSNYVLVAEPPLANFGANPLISCAGNAINFTDFSTTSTMIDSWFWDFGDGTTSTLQHPFHSYNLSGNYDVSLVASTIGCSDTFVIYDYIEIIEPTAFFTPIFNCVAPLSVEFTNLSIGADNVFWDFGDGTSSTLVNPTHVFPSRGTFNVSLTASNLITSCSHTFILPITITQPVANFTYLINGTNTLEDSVGCKPHKVYLNNLSQDFAWFKVYWEDGFVTARLDHQFDTIGTFDVSMIVTDLHHCKDTFVYQNMYSIKGVDADFEIANTLGCDSMLVEFNDLTIPSSNLTWQFGDGGGSILQNPQYIYYSPGFYDVTLYAESPFGCRDTMKKIEYVQFVYPIADFSVTDSNICINQQITFSNHSVGLGLDYLWDFGDGTNAIAQNNAHEYNQNGMYDISLSVIDSFGCINTLMKNAYVHVQNPVANFTVNNISANCPPLISNFNNNSSADATDFTWNFGDGTNSILSSPSHLFANSGSFDISLVVENNLGCVDTFTQIGLINISGPLGTFNIVDQEICLDDTAFFTANVSNTTNYLWDFGDGTFSVDSQATHVYSITGIYYPLLVLENGFGCQFVVPNTDSLLVRTMNVEAGNTITICKEDSVILNASADIGTLVWSPSSVLSDPNVLHPTATPMSTTLFTLSVDDGICQNSDTVRVVVNQDVPNPIMYTSHPCEVDTLVLFGNSGLNTSNVVWNWDLGNGNISNTQNTSQHYANAGHYLISLLVTNQDNGCSKKIYQDVEIYESPIADFIADEVCLGDLTIFNNISTSTDGIVMQNLWEFGDNAGYSSQENTAYQYNNSGTYLATLHVMSDYGCESEISKNVIVNELPTADFTLTNSCLNTLSLFQSTSNLSNGNLVNWIWTFGDGSSFSGDKETQYTYSNAGQYDVNLIVVSDKGCEDNTTKQIEIYPLPNPDFTTDYLCEGEITAFYNNSTITSGDIIAWNWNFGDGIGVANSVNTNYTYTNTGNYPVGLTVMSDKLCEASITQQISIAPIPKVNIYTSEIACVGEAIRLVDLSEVEGGYITSWNWNLGDGISSTQQQVDHTYSSDGTYSISIEVSSNNGCSNTKEFVDVVHVYAKPIANFTASNLILYSINPKVELFDESVGANNWLWDFGDGQYTTIQHPTYTYSDTGKYTISLKVENEYGCSDKFYRDLFVRPEFTLFVPNSFTPNSDGLDDEFLAYGEGINSFSMSVFNRWGEKIFVSQNIDFGWNGMDSFDRLLPIGTYLYHISITDSYGKPWVYNGEINLMR